MFGVRPQAVGAMEGKIAFETDGDVPTMASSSNCNEKSQGQVNEIEGLDYFPYISCASFAGSHSCSR